MSLAWLAPAGFAALAGLLLPLLVHLVRRTREQQVDFAALRWLQATQRPQRRLVVEEPGLLALRLLLVAALAAFLATPVLVDGAGSRHWVVLVPGVDPAQARQLPLPEQAQWRWLAVGFPGLADTPGDGQPVASLLRELDARLPADTGLSVVTPVQLDGLDGERPRLGRDVQWLVTDATAEPSGGASRNPPRMALRHGPGRDLALRFLQALPPAWQAGHRDAVPLDSAESTALPSAQVDVLFWLHPGPLPAEVREWTSQGRTLVLEPDADRDAGTDHQAATAIVARDHEGDVLARVMPLDGGRMLRLEQPLHPGTLPQLYAPDFPRLMLELLDPAPAPAQAPAGAMQPRRMQADSDGVGIADSLRPLQPWLAVVIAVMALAERLLATRARRWQR